MKIIFLYTEGRIGRVEAIQAKEAPSEFFYGAIELAQQGHTVDFQEVRKTSPIWVTASNILFKGVFPVRTSGDDIVGVGQLLHHLRQADCVVATTTSLALALSVWRKIHRIRTPMVGIHCGLLNYPPRGVKLWSTRTLLKGQPMVFFARPEAEAARTFFRLSEIFVAPFGVDTDFWCPADFEGNYVLSIGSDARRDYDTLLAAAEQCSLPLKIVTSHFLPDTLPKNVSRILGSWKKPVLDDLEILHLYRKAKFIVIPLHESLQPSGQSVALQAMACGKPVILTQTKGLWTGHDFNNNREIILVPGKNPTVLSQQMLKLWNNPAECSRMGALARETVLRVGNIRSFANGILQCCNKAVEPIPKL